MTVEEAFKSRQGGISVTHQGKVVRVITDDHEGVHHQRFVVGSESGLTVLVAHNLERAYRAPVKIGDSVEVRGTYVWNKQGGIIHNTHHDDRQECEKEKGDHTVCGQKHKDGWIVFVGMKDPHRTKNSPEKGYEIK